MAARVHLGFRAHCAGLTRNPPSPLVFSGNSSSLLSIQPSLSCGPRKRESNYIRGRGLRVSCKTEGSALVEKNGAARESSDGSEEQLSIVMKFGGSSVASAERMKEVADLIRSFPEERPIIVLSAMGKTTNNLLLVTFKLPRRKNSPFHYLFSICSLCIF